MTTVGSSGPAGAPWVAGTRVRFARTVTFSCAHRYYDPNQSEEANKILYGSLYRDEGFGHNFLLEAHFEGDIDPMTGMIVNLVDVDRWLKAIAVTVDHKHLNKLAIFRDKSPTPERISQYFHDELELRLKNHLKELRAKNDERVVRLVKVRLYEGDDLWVDYGSIV